VKKHDDFSSYPHKWSISKLMREYPNGMPAVVAEYRRRLNECDVGRYRGIDG